MGDDFRPSLPSRQRVVFQVIPPTAPQLNGPEITSDSHSIPINPVSNAFTGLNTAIISQKKVQPESFEIRPSVNKKNDQKDKRYSLKPVPESAALNPELINDTNNKVSEQPENGEILTRRETNNHFTIEIPAPQKYLEMCEEVKDREFTHTRYTAVTCSADDFSKPEMGYKLRQRELGRSTELFIVITMYNEDEILFARTMASVMKNISFLCSYYCPRSWGPNGWTNVVVCIVADGRAKIHNRVVAALSVMGVYPQGHNWPTSVNGNPVTAHLFEFTTQVCVDGDMNIRNNKDGIVPVQILFCLKERNAKKINSHRWFFNAFGRILNPNVCVLLDVGTKPSKQSLYHLWKTFDRDPNVAGACGEICAQINYENIWNPLVAAQNFEYKMSNILDKPLESVFGYIQVLPGAFSAYRYDALQNSGFSTGPLSAYFKGETLHSGEADVFSANMYLAEDRVLCFELVTKKNSQWTLKYVKDAAAETDVPSTLPELVSQRRRWLNGSFFASVNSITNFSALLRSNHSIIRKAVFLFQALYNSYNLLFTWFSIANFYLVFDNIFSIVNNPITDPFNGNGPVLFQALRAIYIVAVISQIIISFGNRPQGSKNLYYLICLMFVLIMGFTLYMGLYTVYFNVTLYQSQLLTGQVLLQNEKFRDIVVSLGATYGVYLVSSLMFFDPWHMITSMCQYMLLLPIYTNIFMIYACK